MTLRVGLLVGREWSFPPAFIEEVKSGKKKAFKKTCIDAEAELTAAIAAFKKSFA